MTEYVVCILFWGGFTFGLYALGNALVKEDETQAYKFVAGYLFYSFFVAVGGIIVQINNFPWIIFAVYMCLLIVGLVVFVVESKIKSGKLFSTTLRQYVGDHWFLFVVCSVLVVMLFFYFRCFWYGNHLDDGYYLTKVATLPFEETGFRTNYSVGVEQKEVDTYVFNTWELEASFFVRALHVKASLFLRLFQSAFHYFLLLNCILAFGCKIANCIKVRVRTVQYSLSIVLIFGIYYVYLMDTNLFYVRDMFHFNSAMYYGSSLVKVIGILLLLVLYIDKPKIEWKMILGVVGISFVLISKSSIMIPVIFIVAISFSLIWLFWEKNIWKVRFAALLVLITIGVGVILPPGVNEQKEVYKFAITSIRSPVVIICIIIFILSFTLKEELVKRLNGVFIIISILILVPQINDVFEQLSFFAFVAARAWSLYVYSFVILNIIYSYFLLDKYFDIVKIKSIYILFAILLTGTMIYGYAMDGGELFVTDELPVEANIYEDFKVLYNNHEFIPNSTIELGENLEKVSKDTKKKLLVVSPEWAPIDGTVHTLATQIRIFAPSIVSVSASGRYSVEENSKIYGYNQSVYDAFVNKPNELNSKKFKNEVEKYDINCVVVMNNSCNKYLEEMGFKNYSIEGESVYYIWYK